MNKLSKIDQLKLQWKSLKFQMWDSFRDALNLFVPVFSVVGMLALSAKFWLWVFF